MNINDERVPETLGQAWIVRCLSWQPDAPNCLSRAFVTCSHLYQLTLFRAGANRLYVMCGRYWTVSLSWKPSLSSSCSLWKVVRYTRTRLIQLRFSPMQPRHRSLSFFMVSKWPLLRIDWWWWWLKYQVSEKPIWTQLAPCSGRHHLLWAICPEDVVS